MLRDLELLPIYESPKNNIIQELIVPLLQSAKVYLRGVGFFSSAWLRLASEGLMGLIGNGGKGQIVMSPILSEKDWEAIKLRDEARESEFLKKLLLDQIPSIRESLQSDTLNALAWMISDSLLDFRFAIPVENTHGNYHDKVGIFIDDSGDIVAIHGSFNDSAQATLNLEAFSVFKSWEPGQEAYVKSHFERLRTLFDGGNLQFKTLPIPEAVRQKIINLRNSSRPYKFSGSPGEFFAPNQLNCPFDLHPFQKEAIRLWFEKQNRGMFEMATGTGKTITSLAAAVDLFKTAKRLILLIVVPYLHLMEQWTENCRKFDMIPILCSGQHTSWKQTVISKIQDFQIGSIDFACFIAIQHTVSSPDFQKIFSSISQDFFMEIVDEAHYLGAPQFKVGLLENAKFRLGLSATPKRWFDPDGTKTLMDFFSGTCFEFSLAKAIKEGFLANYDYFPIPIKLGGDEIEEYERLTEKIRIIGQISSKESKEEREKRLNFLLIERSRIISNACEKKEKLLQLIQGHRRNQIQLGETFKNALVYCHPGKHKEILLALSQLDFNCHEFVHSVSYQERTKVLDDFEQGKIQVLVAIKCLDEGVDIPGTRSAYFLANTTNPKEFIQRRGRILRKCKGKDKAAIFDFIVLPEKKDSTVSEEVARSLIKREIPRFSEFSRNALNEFQARSEVREILDSYGMLDLLDHDPWEIYHGFYESEFFQLEGDRYD